MSVSVSEVVSGAEAEDGAETGAGAVKDTDYTLAHVDMSRPRLRPCLLIVEPVQQKVKVNAEAEAGAEEPVPVPYTHARVYSAQTTTTTTESVYAHVRKAG